MKCRTKQNNCTCATTVIVFIMIGTLASIVQGDRLSACFNSSKKSIDISCGAGSMVRILKAFYGYSPTEMCEFREGDCILPEYEDYPCVGRESCSINLPTGMYGSLIKSCGRYSNYFQVEYECVAAAVTHDLCSAPRLTEQSGYIATPRYPNNYHKQMSCKTIIQVDPSQRILLHIIDLELLQKGKTDCADWMYFNDKFHTITLCGRRANDTYKTFGNYLEIELHTSGPNTSKGFWLYYEAFPALTSSTDSSLKMTAKPKTGSQNRRTSTSTILKSLTTKTTEPTHTPIPVYRVTPAQKSLPFAEIAGGVIGTLTLILIILLALLLVKWIKDRRYQQDKALFLDHRNPAFRESGDFNRCSIDSDYYHC
ncbi:uncharacterized protein LOC121370966 [Gigantopelta aegis]|uniref:uncharacterized protein LOC121370966 n=1 Tax=Gigantopelta aegis TaxID=1735272 RepID=UPI001B88AE5D|nr:uncharacterized protein LOC121370966 [Gigantopelta aegis]XP_041352460.1 uncharacterized protein LOC121370966 [Gigantopelta aegis]XP_041352461.1 uncharacterized protein LOC121370966 [Gigantopelta aegis]XP_041352462.1 uncharacterized protein LOC121370966 [Gigantopelta aegis]XP_041352463.1 uncharacterized protein LOC121370966 [Gigantopelta aegis]XP_041352464.1 uncharacterized protein LOC121370966 [Gigantopelta aegis]